MREHVRVIFIRSSGHSGSTLLDLLISGHPDVISMGELARFNSDLSARCNCGAKTVCSCPFWMAVDDVMQRRYGMSLDASGISSEISSEFCAHNLALFESVREVSGKHIIVDSSKDVQRLQQLLGCDALDVTPIHLVRKAHGVVWSEVKRGRAWRRAVRSYMTAMMKTRRVLRGRPHVHVEYEKLAAEPQHTLQRIMGELDLTYQPQQLDWTTREDRHNVGGNSMRFGKVNTIRVDEAWRANLTRRQKFGVSARSLPVHVPGTWFYELWRLYYDRSRILDPYYYARGVVGDILQRVGLKEKRVKE